MNVIVTQYDFTTIQFERVLQVTYIKIGDEDDDKKYNRVSILFETPGGGKSKYDIPLDSIYMFVVLNGEQKKEILK